MKHMALIAAAFCALPMLETLRAADVQRSEKPDITKLSAAEINKVQPPPAGLFPVPFSPQVPIPFDWAYGGMFLWWNDGTYYMIYDACVKPLPLYLMTSKDGVYWKQEGAYFDKDEPGKCVYNPEIYKLKPDGPFVMAYAHDLMRFATSYDMKQWTRLGTLNGYKKLVELRKEHPAYCGNFDTPVSFPHPDGGWFHLIYAENKEYIGMGFARSKDGIHYDILPPVKFLGVPGDRFTEKPLMAKGGETAGITKIGNGSWLRWARRAREPTGRFMRHV
jgi:hypothetical protein